jgi:hypothetical protein
MENHEPQLLTYSSQKSPVRFRFIALARTAQKTSCHTIHPLLSDVLTKLLPSNGSRICYSGSVFTARCLAIDAFSGSVIPAWAQKRQTLLDNGNDNNYVKHDWWNCGKLCFCEVRAEAM